MPDTLTPAPAAAVAVARPSTPDSGAALLDAEKKGQAALSGPDKARFYKTARGSATECGAVVDLLPARGLIGSPLYGGARTLIVRIVQMLTQLGARMATRHASREEL